MTTIRRPLTGQPAAEELPQPVEQHFHSSVLVPILQNILGGLGVALLVWVAYDILARRALVSPDPGVAWFWARVLGIGFAAFATVLRFFADDVGLIKAAYEAGADSRQDEVNHLQMEVDSLRRRILSIPGINGDGETREYARAEQVLSNARLLIERYYNGHSITRADVIQGTAMGQKDWNRAYALLRHARIVDEDGAWLVEQYDDAVTALDDGAAPGLELARYGGQAAWAL